MPVITKDGARQGDVFVIPTDSFPEGLSEAPRDNVGGGVLAYGEHSGHAHRIRDKHVTFLRMAGSEDIAYFEVSGSEPATLNHEYDNGTMAEHHPIKLPPGKYRVALQREYTPEAIVRAQD